MRSLQRALVLGATLAAAHSSAAPSEKTRTLAEWVVLDFDWKALNTSRAAAVAEGVFKPENCALTGLKAYKGRIFATVPRWRDGVPSTLNEVVWPEGENKPPVLRPYPSASLNDWKKGGPALRYVQSMEVDPLGRMWIIDVGRVNIVESPDMVVNGPASLIIWDIEANKEVFRMQLSEDVAPSKSNFLNDIVVDPVREVAYISDAGGDGALVIVDTKARRAARFADDTTSREPDVEVAIGGISYGTGNFTTPMDGIALSPDWEWVYYCALQGLTLYRVPTSVLLAMPFDHDAVAKSVEKVGRKGSPADGMVFSADGRLFSGGITDPENNVWLWKALTAVGGEPLSKRHTIADAEWADTFAWDGRGALLWTTNRLQRYFKKTMDFTGKEGPNFRILSQDVDGYSYMERRHMVDILA